MSMVFADRGVAGEDASRAGEWQRWARQWRRGLEIDTGLWRFSARRRSIVGEFWPRPCEGGPPSFYFVTVT